MRLLSLFLRCMRREPLGRDHTEQIADASLVPTPGHRELAVAKRRFGAALLMPLPRLGFPRLHHDERGQMLPLMAAAMGFMVVAGVMTIDVGLILDERREAQAAADFAALAAAQDLPADPLDPQLATKLATAQATAADYLRRNGFDPADADVTATITTSYGGGVDKIEVVVTRPREWTFGRVFRLGPVNVQGRAVARADSVPRDVLVVLDRSGSMCEFTHGGGGCPNPPGDPDGNGMDDWQPFDQMRDAATGFGDKFRPFVDGAVFDQMGLVSYATDASLDLALTTDFGAGSAYDAAIDGMSPNGWTNIGHALYLARTELEAEAARGAQQVIVLLTDGRANRYLDGGDWDNPDFASCSGGCSAADDDAIQQAQIAASNGIAIYTIGLTGNAGQALMQQIADIGATQGPGGQFFDVTDPSDLDAAFAEIAALLNFALIE